MGFGNSHFDSQICAMKTFKIFLPHALWLCAVVLTARFSYIYSKVESCMGMLLVSQEAYEVKSGSLMHDARISNVFNSNRINFRRIKDTSMGSAAYQLLKVKSSANQKEWFRRIDDKYLNDSKPSK